MKNYILYAGIGEGHALEVERGEFHSEEDARERAHYLACELYHLNNKADIVEISRLFKVDYDSAQDIYDKEMNDAIDFYVEEILEQGNGYTLTSHS